MLFLLKARTPTDAEEGLLFMQEMFELAKTQSQQPDTPPHAVAFAVKGAGDSEEKQVVISAGPAHFGRQLRGNDQVSLII
jgi:mannosidase alpha-like ER degradation enhancer 3